MTFDDQLKQAVDTLGDRLRDEISRELRLITDELSTSAKADRDAAVAAQAAESAALAASERAASEQAAAERAAAERVAAERIAAERIAAERIAAERAASERAASDRAASDGSAFDRLVEAVRAIDQARSLSEILDTLVASAARDASRAGVLLVSGRRLRRWRFVGFPASFDEDCPVELPLGDADIIADAVERRLTSSTSASGKPVPPFAELAGVGKINAIAIPIALAGEVVAVLYADDQGKPQPGNREPGTLNLAPATLEVLARHAARSLEAVTAFKAARSVAGADTGSESGVDRGGTLDVADAHEADEAARRYARLLISEIKLYHEETIALGRRDRDLATRLGGEIARARALYEQRVPANLRGAAEYFHAELVRTLGSGDASLFAKTGVS